VDLEVLMSSEIEVAISIENVARSIYIIRGQRVMLDKDLAILYGVTNKRFNEQVKRNQSRFPLDFRFQLTRREFDSLKSQTTIFKTGHGQHRKYLPYAFTEHGALMAASILNTQRAVQTSVYVIRAFVRLREFLATHKELADKLVELEQRVAGHD